MRRASRLNPRSKSVLFLALGAFAACQGQCYNPPPESVLSVDFVSPVDARVLTVNDDAVQSVAGFQFDVTVKAADSLSAAVTLESASLQTRLQSETTSTAGPAGQISGDTVTFPAVELRQGINVLQVNVTEATSGRTASKSILVDVQLGRPEVLTFRFQGDANNDGALSQAEQASGPPVAIITVRGVEDNQPITVKDQGAAGTIYGTGTVQGGAATVTLAGLNVTDTTEATFQLVASVVDRGGRDNVIANPTPSQPLNLAAFRGIVVDRVVPVLTVITPTVPGVTQQLNMTDDADPSAPGFQVRITIATSADVGTGGAQITQSPPGTVTPLTPDTSSHQATLVFDVPDAGPYDYNIQITVADPAGNTRTRSFNLQIGAGGTEGFLSAVVFSDNTLNDPPEGPFKFDVRRTVSFGGDQAIVSLSNVGYWSANNPSEIPQNVIVDQDLSTAGAQIILLGTIAGGDTCVPELRYNGTTVATGAVLTTNSPRTVTLNATLASGTAGGLRLVANCAGSVYGRPATNLRVDIDPPSALTPTLTLLTTGPYSERLPGIQVAWTGGNDDGSNGSGTASGYLTGWSTDAATPHVSTPPVPGDYDARLGIESDHMYFAPAAVRGGPLAGTVRAAQISGLPSIGSYYVQVRASDDVGNFSPLAPTNCVPYTGTPIAGTCIDHQLNVAAIENTGQLAGCIGYYMETGDVNGDGRSDLAYISNSTAAARPDSERGGFIAYGNSNMAAFVSSSVQLTAAASTIDAVTGFYDVAVGNVGDRTGDPAGDDVLLAAPRWASGRGRYLLFFGQPGTSLDTANPVELRGLGAGSNAQVTSRNDFGYAQIVPDFSRPGGGAPDGLAEVAIAAHNENSGIGRVYLFYGRPHSTTAAAGSWESLRQTDTDGRQYIPVASADRIFDGEAPPTCQRCASTPPNPTHAYFGTRRGYAALGDLDGDGVTDFGIPDARDFVNRLYLFSGALASQVVGNVPPSGSHLIQRLEVPEGTLGALPSGSLRGFGSDAVGGVNILRGAARDLVVGFPVNNAINIYADGNATGFSPAVLTVAGVTSRFGKTIAVADVNGDGRMDLVVGSDAGVAIGDGHVGGGYVLYNTGQSGAEFDARVTGPNVSRLRGGPTETLASDSMGISVAAGDFNGDGMADVAVADHRMTSDTTRFNQGKIFVRY